MLSLRLPLPAAYIDPAFIKCLDEAFGTPELVHNFDRLYGATLASRGSALERMVDQATGKARDDMRAFVEFVHRSIYLTLSDEAIESLRITQEVNHA